MRRSRSLLASPFVARSFVLALALPFAVRAQNVASVHPTPPVVANAARRTGPIVIDGIPDEAAWSAAQPTSDFHQQQPTDGAAPSVTTEVRFLYDDAALYISARMSDPSGPHGLHAPLARRDQLLDGNGNNGSFNSLTTDKFYVSLDPYHNHLDVALFEINPAGVRGDSFNGDDGWDPVWQAAAHVDSAGWTAEMRIPFSQLRFRSGEDQTWGLQMWRYVDRLNEQDMWAYRKLDEAHGPAFFGHLAGMKLPPQPRAAEVVPYVVTKGLFQPAAAGDPFHSSSDSKLNAGADVKYLITPNLTLNATLNPDFGQVEVDPASLNLSAYETFYDEKRPFFVTDQSPFYFGGASCMFCSNFSSLDVFYTRRIGRPPQLAGYVGNAGAYADVPDNATILGAAKVTGRTASGYTIGILDAVTNKETARYVAAPGDPVQEQMVEPLTNYFVGRVSKELRQGATTIGGIVTSTLRSMGGDTVVANRLRSRATTLGMDWEHGWHNRDYVWMGSVALSDVEGSSSSIALTQQSVTHYYQRPDRTVTSDGLFSTRYDPAATSMRGYGLYTRVARQSGDWQWEVMENIRSPGFEVNDLAYLGDADYLYTNANILRQWTRPTRWYRSMGVTAGGQVRFTYDGTRDDEQEDVFYQWSFPNYWRLRVFGIYRPSSEDARLARGGPVLMRNGYRFGHFQVSTDARKPAVFDLTFEGSTGTDDPTADFTIAPGVAIKPASNVFVQLSPTWNSGTTSAQYVTAVADPTATAFAGHRYVFAWLDSRTLSLDTRVNWTFTPNLTLQVYAQPYISAAAFSRFREFAAPRTLTKRDYGTDVGTITYDAAGNAYTVDPDGAGPAAAFTFANPSQTYRALRGTAVLRWEYRPGSTIFFAWTQQRSGASTAGDFDLARDRTAMLADPANNVFVVKMNWWVGR
ncbi:MAG TPA: DUF5916 domain-containing protein [Gemmatimonadaceae bacterium]|nr:DUF5916 domain-containing protein [Gemmatimonadaceae bacterium]